MQPQFTGSSPLGPGNRAQSALSCVAKLCVVLQNAVIEFSRCKCAKGIDDLRPLIAPSACVFTSRRRCGGLRSPRRAERMPRIFLILHCSERVRIAYMHEVWKISVASVARTYFLAFSSQDTKPQVLPAAELLTVRGLTSHACKKNSINNSFTRSGSSCCSQWVASGKYVSLPSAQYCKLSCASSARRKTSFLPQRCGWAHALADRRTWRVPEEARYR